MQKNEKKNEKFLSAFNANILNSNRKKKKQIHWFLEK